MAPLDAAPLYYADPAQLRLQLRSLSAIDRARVLADRIDLAAVVDFATDEPQHEDLFNAIADLAGGLAWLPGTHTAEPLRDCVYRHCENAAQEVKDENPDEFSYGLGGNDPDHGPSAWLEDAMDAAFDAAAQKWIAATMLIAEPLLAMDATAAGRVVS